ncbi:MAG: hypothetical protein Q6370_021280 [Candidatus Sigynarchaeota archaeon]
MIRIFLSPKNPFSTLPPRRQDATRPWPRQDATRPRRHPCHPPPRANLPAAARASRLEGGGEGLRRPMTPRGDAPPGLAGLSRGRVAMPRHCPVTAFMQGRGTGPARGSCIQVARAHVGNDTDTGR